MLTEDEKRALSLAVQRYGMDQTAADRVVQKVLRERDQGRHVDLLERLGQAKLLDAAQVRDLRLGLDKTHTDLRRNNTAPAAALDLRKLKRLGDCRVLRMLGEGGMGAVSLAF